MVHCDQSPVLSDVVQDGLRLTVQKSTAITPPGSKEKNLLARKQAYSFVTSIEFIRIKSNDFWYLRIYYPI